MELSCRNIDYHMVMSQILRCDCLHERTRWSYIYLVCARLPFAHSLGIKSLIHEQWNLFYDFLVVLGENAHQQCSENSQQSPKEKERDMLSSWCSVKFCYNECDLELASCTVVSARREINFVKLVVSICVLNC